MSLHLLLLVLTLYFIKTTEAYSPSSFVFQKHHSPLGIPWQGPPVTVSEQLYNTTNIAFKEHNTDPPWLGMELDVDYIRPVLDVLNTTDQPLLSRGEAHITVISPPEYKVLSSGTNLTIDWLNDVARKGDIQASEFNVVCLGKVMQQNNVVYQLIVSSPSLVRLRERIFRSYYLNHGNPSLFDPHAFWPHITIGYTDHDLFTEQGVYKGLNACYRPIIFDQ